MLFNLVSNDNVSQPMRAVADQIKDMKSYFDTELPEYVLFFAQTYNHACICMGLEMCGLQGLGDVNWKVAVADSQVGDRAIHHSEISGEIIRLYRHDGLHLSLISNDIFISSPQGTWKSLLNWD